MPIPKTSFAASAFQYPVDRSARAAEASAAGAALAGFAARVDLAFAADARETRTAVDGDALLTALQWALAHPELVPPDARSGCAERYARHLLYADPRRRYTVVSLVWQPGQFSPAHGHHTWCGYAVLDGELVETQYAWDAGDRRARAVRRVPRATGGAPSFVTAGVGGIHRLGNASRQTAVSLHIYGVDVRHVATHVNALVET